MHYDTTAGGASREGAGKRERFSLPGDLLQHATLLIKEHFPHECRKRLPCFHVAKTTNGRNLVVATDATLDSCGVTSQQLHVFKRVEQRIEGPRTDAVP